METTKLPQPYGLRLETMFAKGFRAEEALQLIRRNDPAELREKVDPEAAWESFLEFANAHPETIEAAVRDGYRFPFLTIGGLRSLLSIKYNKKEDRDYRVRDNRVEQLFLTRSELASLRRLAPNHWRILERAAEDGRAEDVVGVEIVMGGAAE